ncbi:MAG: NADH-quinone oxidoreductase subunit L [Nitrospirae bacterium]|nr:NADH-quinone oxidoreductase subunit L [Nitrospirota bacterium]
MQQESFLYIPLMPLVAFAINILLGRRLFKDHAHWIAIAAVAGSFVLSLLTLKGVLNGHVFNFDLYTWLSSGDLRVSVGFMIDQLTAVMLIVVTTISLLVHIYSIGYMHGDNGYYRFFAYLSLFTFSMLMLVMSNNFLQLYFGWEAVGLCSYFLIGFWYEKRSAAVAAKKAFIVNRFGDFGFGLGVILVFLTFGSLHYDTVFRGLTSIVGQTVNILGIQANLSTVIALLLFCGAAGKSAQIPLHVWLPDAMEGPTPVSALIHAATMVTAGVFMVARTNPLFNASPTAMTVVAIVGGLTALFAATIALVQNDIKRVIAYSTVSQLGYMFIACGVGAYAAGIFHLYTHAFFKALLFLGAGSVMHAMQGELNVQKMGGLKRHMPITFWTMLLASLSISGIPGLSGFFSKDEILWRAFSCHNPAGVIVWMLATAAALMTAFYSFRVVFLTFYGDFRGDPEVGKHLHESPYTMTLPLIVLGVGAVAAGYVGIPHVLGGHDRFAVFMSSVVGEPSGEGEAAKEWAVMIFSVIVSLAGIGGAYFMYIKHPELPKKFAERFSTAHRVLLNKYYVDEIYELLIIRSFYWISDNILNRLTDRTLIEGIVNGVPSLVNWLGGRLRLLQTGVLLHYTMIMATGLMIIAFYVLLSIWNTL